MPQSLAGCSLTILYQCFGFWIFACSVFVKGLSHLFSPVLVHQTVKSSCLDCASHCISIGYHSCLWSYAAVQNHFSPEFPKQDKISPSSLEPTKKVETQEYLNTEFGGAAGWRISCCQVVYRYNHLFLYLFFHMITENTMWIIVYSIQKLRNAKKLKSQKKTQHLLRLLKVFHLWPQRLFSVLQRQP